VFLNLERGEIRRVRFAHRFTLIVVCRAHPTKALGRRRDSRRPGVSECVQSAYDESNSFVLSSRQHQFNKFRRYMFVLPASFSLDGLPCRFDRFQGVPGCPQRMIRHVRRGHRLPEGSSHEGRSGTRGFFGGSVRRDGGFHGRPGPNFPALPGQRGLEGVAHAFVQFGFLKKRQDVFGAIVRPTDQ
jgi:hypothetical protein